MHPRLRLVLLGIALATGQGAAQAAPLDTTGASQCETRGFSNDPDPKGTNVRSAPRADAPIIGRIAPRERIAPDTYTAVYLEILGSKDGWLLIRSATPGTGLTLDPTNAADGRGWVSGGLVSATLGSPALRTSPRSDAPRVAKLAGPSWSPDSVSVSAIHACQGKYVEVTGTPIGGKPLRGWSWSPCSSQRTTCDHGSMTE